MWFFDAVLEEKPVAAVATPVAQTATTTIEDDGSFLIISDTPTVAQTAPTPVVDTSDVMLFDAALEPSDSVASAEAATDDVMFFSDTSAESGSISDTSEGQVDDVLLEATSEPTIIDMAPAAVAPAVSLVSDDLMMSFTDNQISDTSSASSGSSSGASAKQDPNAILEKAIAELESLRANHVRLSEEKGKEIEVFNTRIAEAKAGAKEALGAQKKIETEIARVDEMKKLFISQLSK